MDGKDKSATPTQERAGWSPHERSERSVHNQTSALVQRSMDNQAMQRMLRSGAIRAKLEVNSPDDPYERQADHVAARVMASPMASITPTSSPIIQRRCACGAPTGVGGECAECRAKRLGIQRKH